MTAWTSRRSVAQRHRAQPQNFARRVRGHPAINKRRNFAWGLRRSFEQIDAVERARAHVTVVIERVAAAAFLIAAFDIDRPGPVLGSLGRLERAFLPLRFPVLDVHLLDRTVEILDFDRAIVVVESHHFEQRATVEAVPVADTGLRSRHRRHLPRGSSLHSYDSAYAL